MHSRAGGSSAAGGRPHSAVRYLQGKECWKRINQSELALAHVSVVKKDVWYINSAERLFQYDLAGLHGPWSFLIKQIAVRGCQPSGASNRLTRFPTPSRDPTTRLARRPGNPPAEREPPLAPHPCQPRIKQHNYVSPLICITAGSGPVASVFLAVIHNAHLEDDLNDWYTSRSFAAFLKVLGFAKFPAIPPVPSPVNGPIWAGANFRRGN